MNVHLQKIYFWVLILAMLPACNQPPANKVVTDTPPPTVPTANPFPEALLVVQKKIAEQVNLSVDDITLLRYENAQWSNNCLDWPESGVECLETITAGYSGVFNAGIQDILFRTNLDGSITRIFPAAAMQARQLLAEQTGVEASTIMLNEIEMVDWPDACLGIPNPEQICAQVITPGYRVTLQLEANMHEFHTNLAGDQIQEIKAIEEMDQDIYLSWSQDSDTGCLTAKFSPNEIEWGACDSEKQVQSYIVQERLNELERFANLFASFEAETKAGLVNFRGNGSITATISQQRLLAEWASFAFQELDPNMITTNQGSLLTYSVEGGSINRCEKVDIIMSGYADVSSCQVTRPEQVARIWLSDQQLQTIYHYADHLRNFEIEQTEMSSDGALTTRIKFSGRGEIMATPIEQQSMMFLAEEFITRSLLSIEPEMIELARQTLINYFSALSLGEFSDAARLYAGDYQLLRDNNPDLPADDFGGLFQAGCTKNGFVCNLSIKSEVGVAQISQDTFRFSLELQNPDGSLFILGPCCGESDAEFSQTSQFDFVIQKIEDRFFILTLPVYIP